MSSVHDQQVLVMRKKTLQATSLRKDLDYDSHNPAATEDTVIVVPLSIPVIVTRVPAAFFN